MNEGFHPRPSVEAGGLRVKFRARERLERIVVGRLGRSFGPDAIRDAARQSVDYRLDIVLLFLPGYFLLTGLRCPTEFILGGGRSGC